MQLLPVIPPLKGASLPWGGCVLFDVDGTLANLEHRLHHLPNWNAFFEDMDHDALIEPVGFLARVMERQCIVIVVTAREEKYRDRTMAWLHKNNIHPHKMYMRQTGDQRPDQVVKSEILDTIISDGYKPFFVVDDRKRVVDMWRERGLTCFQSAPGDFDERKFEDYVAEQGECLLTLMVGPSGAGKSTYAMENYPAHTIISSDQTRAEICGDYRDMSQNQRVFEAMREQARSRLRHGQPVVIDATNIARKDRVRFVQLAPENSLVRYVIIDRPLREKLRDAGWRADVMVNEDESLIENHHERFKRSLEHVLRCDDLPNVFLEDHRE